MTGVSIPTLTVIGMSTVDQLFEVGTFPVEDSENESKEQSIAIGGPAGRSAIAAGRLGADVHQLSMIGTDVFADFLRDLTSQEPVTVSWFAEEGPSQQSAIILSKDSGARTTIWRSQPPANPAMLAAIDEAVRGRDAVLVDCTDPAVLAATSEACRRHDVPLVIDTGSYKPWAAPLLQGISHVASPLKFLKPYLEAHLPRLVEQSLEEQLEAVRGHLDADSFAVTNGPEGGVVATADGCFTYRALEVVTVDSCGAGDTFHGGLAWGVGSGLPLADAYAIGSWAAGRKCSGLGNGAIPTHEDLVGDRAVWAALASPARTGTVRAG